MKRLIATFLLASCAFAHAAGYTTPTYNDVTIPSGLPDNTTSVKQAIANAQSAAAAALPLSSIPTAPLLGGVSGTGLQSVTPDGTVRILNGQLGLPSANTSGAGSYGNITTDAQGRITAIHAPTHNDISDFNSAAANAAPVQSVGGNVGNISSAQLLSSVTAQLGYTPPNIGLNAGQARDAAAAITAETANAAAAAAAQATANAAVPQTAVGVSVAPLSGGLVPTANLPTGTSAAKGILQLGTTSGTAYDGASGAVNATLASGAAQKANNLSDIASVSTARVNLGLGTAAVANTGTSGGVVGLLNANKTDSGNNTLSGNNTFTGSTAVSQTAANANFSVTNSASTGAILNVGSSTQANSAKLQLQGAAGVPTSLSFFRSGTPDWVIQEDPSGNWALNQNIVGTTTLAGQPILINPYVSSTTPATVRLNGQVRENVTAGTNVLASTIGEVTTWTNNGGVSAGGSSRRYYSNAQGGGYDVAQTIYGYSDPAWTASPITATVTVSGTTMDVSAQSANIPVGSNIGGLTGTPVVLAQLTTQGSDVATYTISVSQTVSSPTGITATYGKPSPYAQFIQEMTPNDSTHSWGAAVAEWDISNRGPDCGFKEARSDQNVGCTTDATNVNPTGGLLLVPETTVQGDGGQGTNATYGGSVARSSGSNSVTGIPNAFYIGWGCEPNSIVGGTGRCINMSGDITGTPARVPYAGIDYNGEWAHGIVTAYSTLDNNDALQIAPGQGIVNTVGSTRAKNQPPTNATAVSGIYGTGSGTAAGWNITTAGTGALTVNGSPVVVSGSVSGILEVDTFTSSGTWTKNTAAKWITVELIGGGSGGAGGTTATSGTAYSGGAGGSGGGVRWLQGPASSFSSSVTVTLCSAAAGGAAGSPGTAGGTASFGAYNAYGGGAPSTGNTTASASGGSGGIRGNGASASGSAVGGAGSGLGVAGASGAAGTQSTYQGVGSSGAGGPIGLAGLAGGFSPDGPSGGGSGGGMAATQAALTGGTGGPSGSQSGGTAGNASNGGNGILLINGYGSGGGGGANNPSGVGYNGGNGGYGAGGGGGGNGSTGGGSGGNGGACFAQVVQQ